MDDRLIAIIVLFNNYHLKWFSRNILFDRDKSVVHSMIYVYPDRSRSVSVWIRRRRWPRVWRTVTAARPPSSRRTWPRSPSHPHPCSAMRTARTPNQHQQKSPKRHPRRGRRKRRGRRPRWKWTLPHQ